MPKKNVAKPKRGAIRLSEKADQRAKEIEFVERARSSVSNDKVRVRIDSRTWIYISPDRDPDVARKNFIDVYGG